MTGGMMFHHKNDEMLTVKLTKRAKAKGKMHTWCLKSIWGSMAFYRCLVCDYYDNAAWPHTPDPHEPYCPSKSSLFMGMGA